MGERSKSPEVWAVMALGWSVLAFVAAVLLGSWVRAHADGSFSMGLVWLTGAFVAALTLLIAGDSRRTAQVDARRATDGDGQDTEPRR